MLTIKIKNIIYDYYNQINKKILLEELLSKYSVMKKKYSYIYNNNYETLLVHKNKKFYIYNLYKVNYEIS